MSKCGSTMPSMVLSSASRSWLSSRRRGRANKGKWIRSAFLYSSTRPGGRRRSLAVRFRRGLLAVLAAVALSDQILADEFLELHRTLRQHHLVAVLERLGRAARLQRHVLVAQQTAGEHGGGGIVGNLVETPVDRQRHQRIELVRFEFDRADRADAHAGELDRRAQLELADVGEARLQRVARPLPVVGDAGGLRREIGERGEPEHDEQAGADLEGLSLCHRFTSAHVPCQPVPPACARACARYIRNAVITKSSASTTIEENTTVRVVA